MYIYIYIYIYICVCVCVGGAGGLNVVVAELGISEGIKEDASILCYSEFRA